MVKKAFFLSYWESGVMLRAFCQVDTENRRVYDIMNAGHPGDNDKLRYEAVEVDGIEESLVNLDEILMFEENIKDAFRQLSEVKRTHRYWYSNAGNMLDEALTNMLQTVENNFLLSYWKSGTLFRAPCLVNAKTHEIFAIVNVGHPGKNDKLLYEAINVASGEEKVVNIDPIILAGNESTFEKLSQIKRTRQYWYSLTGRNLERELCQLQNCKGEKEKQ